MQIPTLFITLIACAPKSNETTTVATVSDVPKQDEPSQQEYNIELDGVKIQARWDDGDTFSAYTKDGDTKKKIKARMNGYNTLESYGPVHSWENWSEQDLYALAKESGTVAQEGSWKCSDLKTGGGYGRLLVDCPELRSTLLRGGYAHPFSVEKPAPQKDIDDLNYAIENKKGMWEKGAPAFLITSLHSQSEYPDKNDEGDYKKNAYNRICDMQTGQCAVREHNDTYEVCQKVCIEDSCMIYVPYANRYKKDSLAECLIQPKDVDSSTQPEEPTTK